VTRTVTVPNGRRVPLRAYVAAWRRIKALDPETEVNGWEWYSVPAGSILRDLRRGLQDRISQGVSYASRA